MRLACSGAITAAKDAAARFHSSPAAPQDRLFDTARAARGPAQDADRERCGDYMVVVLRAGCLPNDHSSSWGRSYVSTYGATLWASILRAVGARPHRDEKAGFRRLIPFIQWSAVIGSCGNCK